MTYKWHAVAEGGAYGEGAAGGNSFSYWFLAVGFAGAAALAAVAPSIVSICWLPVLVGCSMACLHICMQIACSLRCILYK